MIACARLPYFAVTAARQQHTDLVRHEPLALLDADSRVWSISEGAVIGGVTTGMTQPEALAACLDLHIELIDPILRRRAQSSVMQQLTAFSDKIEAETPTYYRKPNRRTAHLTYPSLHDDSLMLYLNLGKVGEDEVLDVSHHLYQSLAEYVPAISVAPNKFTARVAALAVERRRISFVSRKKPATFLADFPVGLLPIDAETMRQLDLLGLRTLGQIADLPSTALFNRFGKTGKLIHRLANGKDNSLIAPYQPPLVVEATHLFDDPVRQWQGVLPVIEALVANLTRQLENAGQFATEIDLQLGQENGKTHEKNIVLRQPTAHYRHISRTVEEMLHAFRLTAGLTDIRLRLTGGTPPKPQQLSLFEQPGVDREQLMQVLRQMVARHGEDTIYWVSVVHPTALWPEKRYRFTPIVGNDK